LKITLSSNVSEEERGQGAGSRGENPINKFIGSEIKTHYFSCYASRNKYFYPGHK
jgi:hypothetical protein